MLATSPRPSTSSVCRRRQRKTYPDSAKVVRIPKGTAPTRCPYRRLHTSFTSLPKAIRLKIKLAQQKVDETDVSNCQALCLGLIAAEHAGRRQRKGGRLSYHMLHFAHQRGASVAASVRRFIECCEEGVLYETLLTKAVARGHRFHDFIYDPRRRHMRDKKTRMLIPNRDLTRDDVKGELVRMIFCEQWKTLKMPLYPIFAEEFLGMADFVYTAKSAEYRGLPRKVAYKELAKDCQHLEASVMIDQVAAALSSRFPVVTVHDSILSPEANATEVAGEIRRRFGDLGVGVRTKSAILG